jgi:GT2 family glycosyltransferase
MWFLISYNRPERCRGLIEQIKSLGDCDEGILVVNGGDVAKYRDIELPANWSRLELQDNLGLLGAANYMFQQMPDEDWYGFITDDEIPLTPGWSQTLVKEAGSWNISHGNTQWQSHCRLHGAPVMGGELLRAVGYVAPTGLWHWYGDDVWEQIAFLCGLRRFCPDIIIEHRHWLNETAKKDETYESSESKAFQDKDIYEKWHKDEFPKVIGRIWEKMALATGNKQFIPNYEKRA